MSCIIISFAVVVGIMISLLLIRAVRVISFSCCCRLVNFTSLESRGKQKQASGFTAIRTSLPFERSFRACSFNFPQFVRLERGVSAVCLDWPALVEEETVCALALGGCMASGCCGSIVIASVTGGCSGVAVDMLRRPPLTVMKATGWFRFVDCISVSSVLEAGGTAAAVSMAWAAAVTSVAWADGTVAVALACLVL